MNQLTINSSYVNSHQSNPSVCQKMFLSSNNICSFIPQDYYNQNLYNSNQQNMISYYPDVNAMNSLAFKINTLTPLVTNYGNQIVNTENMSSSSSSFSSPNSFVSSFDNRDEILKHYNEMQISNNKFENPQRYHLHESTFPYSTRNNIQSQQLFRSINYDEKISPNVYPGFYKSKSFDSNQISYYRSPINMDSVNNNNSNEHIQNSKLPNFYAGPNMVPVQGCMNYSPLLIPTIKRYEEDNKNEIKIAFENEYMKYNKQNKFLKTAKNGKRLRIITSISPAWSSKDDKLLRYLKEVKKLSWKEISKHFPSRTTNGCQFRWRRILNKENIRFDKTRQNDIKV